MRQGDLTDNQWERLQPLLPVSTGRCGRWRDHRQVINGILYRVRTGVHWRDLPERFGPWKTVYEQHRLWSADGTWEWVPAGADGSRPDRLAGVGGLDGNPGSPVGGRCPSRSPSRTRGPTKGGIGCRTPARTSMARPAGRGGAEDEGLGRSRGGFTSKIHLSADGHCRPLSLVVTAGQQADTTQFIPVLEKIRVPRPGPGRPRKKAGQRRCGQGLQQPSLPRLPAKARHRAHHPGEVPGPPPHVAVEAAADRQAFTWRDTRSATRWNARSTNSSSPGQWQPGTTSAVTSSSALSQLPHSSSGSGRDC